LGTEPLIGGEDEQHSQTLADSQNAAASGDQVDDEDDQRDDQQKVDQAAGDVKAEAQKPQNQKDNENGPKHIRHTSLACGRLRREARLRRTQRIHDCWLLRSNGLRLCVSDCIDKRVGRCGRGHFAAQNAVCGDVNSVERIH